MTEWITDSPEMAEHIRAEAADMASEYGLTIDQAEASIKRTLRQFEAGMRGMMLLDDDVYPSSFEQMLERIVARHG